MWLMLCWLVGLPKLLYHFVLTLPVLILYLFYKLLGNTPPATTATSSTWPPTTPIVRLTPQQQHQLNLLEQHRQLLTKRVRERMQLVMKRSVEALRRNNSQETRGGNSNQGERNAAAAATRHFYLAASLILIGFLVCAGTLPKGAHCLEQFELAIGHKWRDEDVQVARAGRSQQDAEILKPVAALAKAVIKTVTLGEALEINFDPSGLVKNFAYFTWRTGFPVSMPKGFVQKAQDFYNRVKVRVDRADVKDVERKSLANLKLSLDEIVDSIVEEVRQSRDGLYTDYLQTRVAGLPLEDACTAVGIQLKAYGVDLTNYRNIAGMVLGIPVMPTVASTMMNVANLASLDTVRDLTQTFNPLNNQGLAGSALQSMSSVSNSALNSIGNFGQQLPMQNFVQSAAAPLNLFRAQPALARR